MKKILYLDDNEDDRYAAVRTFKHSAFSFKCVSTTAEAIAELDSETYDVVISDLIMRGIDGLEFVKGLDSGRNVPFILTSGVPALRSFENYSGLKNYLGFILKPITKEKLEQLC